MKGAAALLWAEYFIGLETRFVFITEAQGADGGDGAGDGGGREAEEKEQEEEETKKKKGKAKGKGKKKANGKGKKVSPSVSSPRRTDTGDRRMISGWKILP